MENIGAVLNLDHFDACLARKLGHSDVHGQACALKGLIQYVIRTAKKTKKSKCPTSSRTETLGKLKAGYKVASAQCALPL